MSDDICDLIIVETDPGNADQNYVCPTTGKQCRKGNCPNAVYNGINPEIGKLE